MSEVLESLDKDQLLEFHYGNQGLLPTNPFCGWTENCFPDLEQMELIWAHQGKLQTLQSTHLLTLFEISATSELEMHAILQPLKELILIEETPQSPTLDLITWPIENIDTSAIRKLNLVGLQIQKNIQKLNNLFAANAFVNLDELYMKEFLLSTPLQLANCASLRSLTVVHFQSLADGAAMLSISHAFWITSFQYTGDDDFNQYKLLPSILRQIQGLSTLVLEITSPEREDDEITEEIADEFRTELANALEVQQATITELMVTEQQFFDARIVFGGEKLFRVVQGCSRLRRLALPSGLEDPIPWYTRLMKDIPNLAYFWLMRLCDYVPHDTEEENATEFKNAIPAESHLQFFAYEHSCYSRQELGNNDITTQDKADAEIVRLAFTRIDWERANPLFYNRYPSVPFLPRDGGARDEGPIDDPESESEPEDEE